MAFKNIVNIFKKREQQRERLAGMLGKEGGETEKASRPVPVLDDIFEEPSANTLAQIKKYPFTNIAEFLETQRTSFNKQTLFVVEILDEVVNAAIVSRKGVFLDIGFLKSYSYDDLKEIYFQIVPDTKGTIEEIRSSVENIISIVAYDVVYALPKQIVIIEGGNGELREINVPAGRFSSDANAKDLMLRELSIETGYSEDDIIYSAIKKPFAKGDREMGFLVSLVEKSYYDSVDSYVNEAGFELKKIHSIHSSLFASFALKGRSSALRIHVHGHMAYALDKAEGEGFEYHLYDINEAYEEIEFAATQAEEVILSGQGDYYEMLKSSLLEAEVSVRWWNYEYDLGRCIIRVDEGVELDNRYANLLSTAYYELFNMRLALIRLGVGRKLSLYEFVAVNLSLLPILIIILSIIGVMGWYFYERMSLAQLEETNKEYSAYFKKEKSLNKDISRRQKSIANSKRKIETINKILDSKIDIQDAAILYEIANKLPDDMILTSIEKKHKIIGKVRKGSKGIEVIEVQGRCYLERSLLDYIEELEIENRKVYLVQMKDTRETRFESNEEANLKYISEFLQKRGPAAQGTEAADGAAESTAGHLPSVGTSVNYADTLNNGFTLEIR